MSDPQSRSGDPTDRVGEPKNGSCAPSAEAGRLWGEMEAAERGLLLFGSELTMLRSANRAGGRFQAPATHNGWQAAAELCGLGLLTRNGETLTVTPRGDRVLRLTEHLPAGAVGYISPIRWRTV